MEVSRQSVGTAACRKPDDIECRDFLLFIPAGTPNLRAVLSYYSSTATLNPEGDVHINDSLQGLGNYVHFRNTHFYETLTNTYISSSNTLLAMAFLSLMVASSSLQEDFDGELEEDSISQGVYRLGNFPSPQNPVRSTNSDSVVSSGLTSLFLTEQTTSLAQIFPHIALD